ncbi:MYND Zn-finger protein [Ceratobasidium sp. AG-Ba]|nr:MYND Zn-finger protein [Ceratobasidium sp. AG-Ba]
MLQILFDHKEKNCTPVLKAHLRLPGTSGLAYSSIYAIWGTYHQVANKVLLTEDEKGFDGTSHLVIIFWANSRLIGYPGSTFSLSIKSTPHSATLFSSLRDVSGHDIDLFAIPTDDANHVRIVHYRPHLKDEPTLAFEDLRDPFEKAGFKPVKDTVLITANVEDRTVVSLTVRIEIDDAAERGVLLEGAEVKAAQVSPCGMKVEIADYEHAVSFPYSINGEGYKLRVARKSHYVEVIVPFSQPLDNAGYYFDKTPILRGANISPWNIPHVTSDRMPLLDLKDPKKVDWIKTLISIQHSVRERAVLNKNYPTEIALPVSHWVNIRNTIRVVTTNVAGVGEMPNKVFTLSEKDGVVYAILLVGGIRLDLASFTVFMDVAVVPPSTEGMPLLFSSIRKLQSAGNTDPSLRWNKKPLHGRRCSRFVLEGATLGPIPRTANTPPRAKFLSLLA